MHACEQGGILWIADMQAFNKGSRQAADCLFSIRERLAASDIQGVSSDQSGNTTGSSLSSQSVIQPKSKSAHASGSEQVQL